MTQPPTPNPNPGVVSALTAEELADKVQVTYQGFSDLRSAFFQRATNRLSGMTQEASGRLFLKWPGRMRWEYEKPESRLFLIDGKTLWSYSPSERQAIAQDVSGVLTTSPIGILFGMSSLRRDFQVRPIVHAGTKESPESLLELTPKRKGLAFKRVILGVDRGSFLIQRLTVFDLSRQYHDGRAVQAAGQHQSERRSVSFLATAGDGGDHPSQTYRTVSQKGDRTCLMRHPSISVRQ
ncbi:MAG: outer membrane lipoprotein carrier protein LolA [Candidatus Methylomirabilis sp.]|nr:outer membrane lipoprotein carrier protein LolA [Candidatus Methylomirabilis sp.]